jgi:hypothetical protein
MNIDPTSPVNFEEQSKKTLMHGGFKVVSSEEWADFTSDYHTYQTEARHNDMEIMYSRLSGTPKVIALVRYYMVNNDIKRVYEIMEDVPAEFRHWKHGAEFDVRSIMCISARRNAK